MKKILCVISLLMICLPFSAYSESLTITGENFGDVGPTIYSWDTFENGSPGQSIQNQDPIFGYTWTTQLYCDGGADDEQPYYASSKWFGEEASGQSLLVDWRRTDGTCTGNTIQAFGWTGHGPISELYVSFYRLQDNLPTTAIPSNSKLMYTFSKTGVAQSNKVEFIPWVINGAADTRWKGGFLQEGPGSGYDGGSAECPWQSAGYWRCYYPTSAMPNYTTLNDNTFHRFEFWVKTEEFATPAANIGATMVWFDQKLLFDPTAVSNQWRPSEVPVGGKLNGHISFIRDDPPNNTDRNSGGYIDAIRIGHMFQDASQVFTRARAYYDNVYIASNRARVEVGDNFDFDLCSKRDVQIMDYWSDEMVYVGELYTPQFEHGESAFVFVVNADGEVSEGMPFAIGEGVVGQLPVLTNLTVQSRLVQVGGQNIFQWENVGGEAETIVYYAGENYNSREGTSIAYQDSIHHTYTKAIPSGSIKRLKFTVIATNTAGSDTLTLADYVTVVSGDDPNPLEGGD